MAKATMALSAVAPAFTQAADAFVSTPATSHHPAQAANQAVAKQVSSSGAVGPTQASSGPLVTVGCVGMLAAGAALIGSASSKRHCGQLVAKRDSQGVVMCAFETELGVQAPVGFWDPVGFTADGDVSAFKRRRSVEIKHGRICMMATMGYITPEVTGKLPGFLSPSAGLKFADIPNGLAAISKVPTAGWAQIAAYFGFVEFSGGFEDYKSGTPGDYGFKVLTSSDPEEKTKKLNAEIANGRLAMMAIIGMFFQDGLTGSAWGDWALYTASPLRAFENETGVQAPVGYWDPLGLASSGNTSDFRRRREVELKHGRVSMFATIGYIVPEYYKLNGFLSPSYGVKFADVPNGLGAISKVPALGWLQFFIFVGLVEINVYGENINGEPGNYGAGFLGLRSVGVMNTGITDPEVRKKKLNAELANGRLAMMAIIGMFFQDGCTGSAWGDWSLYTDSPLRAVDLSKQLGACPPLGFWDPFGLSEFNDPAVAEATFKRRRVVEIQHGRVSMAACIGYIVPEYFKFPGYLSPSEKLAFGDIPNGLAALSKVPGLGVAQMIAFAGTIEIYNLQSPSGEYAGDYAGYGAFGLPGGKPIADKEKKEKSLLAEINNGRLAMMAIIGMFFQDGLTGSAWGDWANYTDSPLRAFESEIGVQAPVGFWDPLGLSKDGDVVAFTRRRETEIKHGRVSMIAAIGYIVPEYYRWPGDLSPSLKIGFSDVPNGLAAISKVPGMGWGQVVAFAGLHELFLFKYEGEPGKYSGGLAGFPGAPFADPEVRRKKLSAELANGRLAMMAVIGMFFQDGLTGSAWGDWSLYTDSPLRSGLKSPGFNTLPEFEKPLTGFEGNIGDQPPLGFWDPAGFTRDGDVAAFTKRREVEIKHGRVSMFATIGYIVPEYFKFPGELSPSMGLKFSDVPNGLGAISKVPAAGWAQIFVFAGFNELVVNQPTGEPGNYGKGFLGLGTLGLGGSVQNPEVRVKKLQAELANGRLAMMAIIGMFFQDGLTGSAWGDWSLYTASPLRASVDDSPAQAWSPAGMGIALGFFASVVAGQPAWAADIENGQQVFGANCAACHAGGNNTVVPEKKLKKEALQQYGKYEVSAIITQVTNGNGAMPAFGERLAPDDIEDVANYVRAQADKGW